MTPFRTPLEIRFGDVDSAGVVYYPRYGHYCHVAMEEFFLGVVGLRYPDFLQQYGLGLPAVRLETDFRHPLRYGDRLIAEVEVAKIGDSSVAWRHRFLGGAEERLAAESRVVTVCVELPGFAKVRVPDWLRKRLRGERL